MKQQKSKAKNTDPQKSLSAQVAGLFAELNSLYYKISVEVEDGKVVHQIRDRWASESEDPNHTISFEPEDWEVVVLEGYVKEIKAEIAKAKAKKLLQESAKAKLTAEEREALGLN